jgi:5-methylthioadenosine/S-adenosylhomocysteine deaminase
VLAHCVHVEEDEMAILEKSHTNVAHCPSSNLKLGSGIARVKEMLDRNISVSLGADGAPCNNRLDMFTEMRKAGLLQKVKHDTTALPARRALRLATIDGAVALGLDAETGSLEIGKRADVTILGLNKLWFTPKPPDVVSSIVYAAQATDVRTTIIDGVVVMRDRKLLTVDEEEVINEANHESQLLVERAKAFQ